jgi:4a-hydroxytetrahydrobiopterin dehydratase
MARPTRLDPDAVTAALAELPAWSGSPAGIERSIEAPSFLAGIELVRRVAVSAEEFDHHPDIDIRWRTVRFALSTHVVADGGDAGVTEYDVEMAHRIDEHVHALV